jgi:hypothetical protein
MSRNPNERPPLGSGAEMDGELRTAYHALADGQPRLSDLPGHVRQTIRKRRVRRLAVAGSTAVVLVPAALIIALSGGGQSQGDQQVIVSTPGPTATPSATAIPTPSSGSPVPVVTSTPSVSPAPTETSSPVAVQTQSSGTPQNLTVTTAVRQQLITVYETSRKLGPNGVKGTRPNSVFYALDPATGIHWAVANFDPSTTLSLQQSVSFQDGGSIGVFRQAPNAGWVLLGGAGAPPDCTGYLPADIRAVWNWPAGPSCGIAH